MLNYIYVWHGMLDIGLKFDPGPFPEVKVTDLRNFIEKSFFTFTVN